MPKKLTSRKRPSPQLRGPRAKHLPKNPDGRVRPVSKPPSQRPPARVSQAEYARHQGVTRQMVSKAVRLGLIPVDRHGRIDPKQADKAWKANTVAPTPPPAAGAGVQLPSGILISYSDARAMHEYYKAELAKLELGERSGELVPLSDVRDVAKRASKSARDLIHTITDRVGRALVGATDFDRVRAVLDPELRRVTTELAMAELGADEDKEAS